MHGPMNVKKQWVFSRCLRRLVDLKLKIIISGEAVRIFRTAFSTILN